MNQSHSQNPAAGDDVPCNVDFNATDSVGLPSDLRDDLWQPVDALLAAASTERVRAHGLGPLEAVRRSRVGAPVPKTLAFDAQTSALAMLAARPLLERIRASCDGPLVLMKGPEAALRYPDAARGFGDIDLLVLKPRRVHDQLREAGFVEAGGLGLLESHHHLRPLRWPELPLKVEIHGSPNWPSGLQAPEASRIIGAARPTDLRVEGILAPDPVQHTLLLAAHAWAHDPLWRLRDLVDVRAFAASSDRSSIERTARVWGIPRLWQTTDRATDAVLGHRQMPRLLRCWSKHLLEQRERTVLESHLRDCMAGYWALPLKEALAATVRAIAEDVSPAAEQPWSDKMRRMLTAAKNARTPMSEHEFQLEVDAFEAREREREAEGGHAGPSR